jgi:hypothetical protein
MPFNPQSLPYKLRALFDANVLSPQDLARSVGVTTAQVDGWLRGRLPDPVTRVQVDKVLSYHARRRNRFLKLEPEVVERSVVKEAPLRGVYEDPGAFEGTIVYNVYAANGRRIGRWEAPVNVTDEDLLEAFDSLVDRQSAPDIAIIPASDEAS